MSLKSLQNGSRAFVFLRWKDFDHIYTLKMKPVEESWLILPREGIDEGTVILRGG